MKKIIIIISGVLLFISETYAQTTYPYNEDGEFEDMLTPEYYLSPDEGSFRNAINKFIYIARAKQFHHPLEDSTGEIPQYITPAMGEFGAGKGPTGTSQHHAAIDLHVGNRETNVTMYAAHDGYINVYRDAPKYRHYLSIRKNITDSTGNLIGKMVTLYAHIDLDLDSADNRLLDGKYVNQGDIVSKHLYSGTVGGPHLHFEIRYYHPDDIGDEEFYGFIGPLGSTLLTAPSAGNWSYGYWNPNIGYGFANPENHLSKSSTGIIMNNFQHKVKVFPNPANDFVTIDFNKTYHAINLSLYNLNGKLLDQKTIMTTSFIKVNLTGYKAGVYLINLTDNESNDKIILKVIKE